MWLKILSSLIYGPIFFNLCCNYEVIDHFLLHRLQNYLHFLKAWLYIWRKREIDK